MTHRAMLISDNTLTRWAVGQLLSAKAEIELTWTCSLSPEVISLTRDAQPDVVILDIAEQGYTALGLARDIVRQIGGKRLLIITPAAHDRQVREVMDMEVAGYVALTDDPTELVAALEALLDGEQYVSSSIQKRLCVESGPHENSHIATRTRTEQLSRRELQVLRLIAQGLTKKLIAEHLELSVKTVDNHATSLMNKLDIHDRVGLARFAFREGLAEP